MNRRFLSIFALLALLLCTIGLLGADRLVAQAIRDSGWEAAVLLTWALNVLDTASGLHVWYWLAGCITLAVGGAGLLSARAARWPRVLIAAALVQFATIATMIGGKMFFGRLRPEQVLASGDWAQLWFAGGGSFPSGHSSFYFGLLLPVAAACPACWQRIVVLCVPLFAISARVNMAKHFLSDVAMSALIAALYALLLATLLRRWLPPAAIVCRAS